MTLRNGITLGTAMDELRVDGLIALAKVAEASGYDLVSVPESWGTESFSLLTALGMSTSRIKVGSAILPIANRSPGLVAQGASTVDDATGGRFVLGLGMGHRTISEGWHGITGYDPRIAWIRDYVLRVRSALAGEPTAGGYTLAYPAHPSIPIYLAALREKGMRLAGEVADGALLYLQPLERIPTAAAFVREGAVQAGRDPESVEVVLSLSTCVTDDPGPARDAARMMLGWYASLPFYNGMIADSGFAAEAAALTAAWARARAEAPAGGTPDAGLAAALVTDAMVDQTFVIGTREQCRARIAEVRSRGVDRVVVYPYGPYPDRAATLAGFTRTIEACAGA